jgi:gentisate 1,2-dioxygenase
MIAVEPELRDDPMASFYRDLEAKHMDALWRGVEGERPAGPRAPYQPCHWRWADIAPFMERAGQLVEPGPAASRRVIQLINPDLQASRSASHSLTANLQMVLPGELAPSHRHTSGAIRFILQGRAAITVVNGEPVEMKPGDLVLTPGWCWHGHINESDGPMVWMDSLDRPLTSALRQVIQEPYPGGGLQPVSVPAGESYARFGPGHLRPIGARPASSVSPLFSFPWEATESALRGLAASEGDPFDDVALDYTNPLTGSHVMPTMGCRIQMIRGSRHTRAHRHSSVGVHHVFRGSGATIVDGVRIDWQQGDFFVVPPFSWHEHVNDGSEDAVLFSTTDQPVLEALCLYREDAYDESDGHQAVTARYSERYGYDRDRR